MALPTSSTVPTSDATASGTPGAKVSAFAKRCAENKTYVDTLYGSAAVVQSHDSVVLRQQDVWTNLSLGPEFAKAGHKVLGSKSAREAIEQLQFLQDGLHQPKSFVGDEIHMHSDKVLDKASAREKLVFHLAHALTTKKRFVDDLADCKEKLRLCEEHAKSLDHSTKTDTSGSDSDTEMDDDDQEDLSTTIATLERQVEDGVKTVNYGARMMEAQQELLDFLEGKVLALQEELSTTEGQLRAKLRASQKETRDEKAHCRDKRSELDDTINKLRLELSEQMNVATNHELNTERKQTQLEEVERRMDSLRLEKENLGKDQETYRRSRIKHYIDAKQACERKLAEAVKTVEERDENIADLKSSLSQQEKDCWEEADRLNAIIKGLEEKLRGLVQESKSKSTELRRAERKMKNTEEDSQLLVEKNVKLDLEVKQCKEETSLGEQKHKQAVKDLEGKNKDLDKQIKEVREQLKQAWDDLKDCHERGASKEKLIGDLQNQLHAANTRCGELTQEKQQEMSKTAQAKKAHQDSNEEHNRAIEALKLTHTNTLNVGAAQTAQNHMREVSRLIDEASDLCRQLLDKETESERALQLHEERVTSLQAEIAVKGESLATMEQEKNREIDKLNRDLRDADESLRKAKEAAAEAQGHATREIEAARAKTVDLQTRFDALVTSSTARAEELTSQVNSLRVDLDTANDQYEDELEAVKKDCEDAKNQLQRDLNAAHETNATLQQQLQEEANAAKEERNSIVSTFEGQIDEANIELDRLHDIESQLASADSNIESLRAEQAAERDACREDQERAAADIQVAEQATADLRAEFERSTIACNQEKEEMKREIEALLDAAKITEEELKAKIEVLEIEATTSAEQLVDMAAQKERLKIIARNALDEVSLTNKRYKELSEECDQDRKNHREAIGRFQRSLKKARQETEDQQRIVQELDNVLKNRDDRLAKLFQEAEKCHKNLQSTENVYRKLLKDFAEIDKQRLAAVKERDAAVNERNTISAQVTEKEVELAEQNAKLAQRAEELLSWKEKHQGWQDKVNAVENANVALQNQLREEKNKTSQLEEESAQMKQKEEQCQMSVTEKERAIADLQSTQEALSRELAQMTAENKASQAAMNEMLNTALRPASEDLDANEDDLNPVILRINDLRRQIGTLEREISDLKSDNADLTGEFELYRVGIDHAAADRELMETMLTMDLNRN